jgi:lipopolysaccharide export system protein LptA
VIVRGGKLRLLLLIYLTLAGGAGPVAAQDAKDAKAAKKGVTSLPSPLQGFSRNRNDPVKIEANALEVRDRDKVATFIGNVFVLQGDTTLRCRELKVFYEGETVATKSTAAQGTSAQRIRKLEAIGGVIITSKDQKATGDSGTYDMRANTMTLTGNVVVTQGPNVMQGDRLYVDLTSGHSRLEAAGKGGPTRVKGLFLPSSRNAQPQEPGKGQQPGK